MIQLVTYLLRTSRALRFSRFLVLVALAAALLSGAGYVALIALLNSALSGRGAGNPWAFAALCLAILLARLASQGLFDYVALKTVSDVRLTLCRRILAPPPGPLEEVGPEPLLGVIGALSDDVTALSTALTELPRVFTNLAISLGCLVYLGWLSWWLLLLTLGFMAVGLAIHQFLLARSNLLFRRLREQRNVQRRELRALIEGTGERPADLIPTSEAIRRFTFSGNALFAAASTWGNILFFVAVALLLFGPGRRHGLAPQVVDGYTMTLLYILLPLEMFFLSLPTLGRAAVAIRKLDGLGLELAVSPGPLAPIAPRAGGSSAAADRRPLPGDPADQRPNRRGAPAMIALLARLSHGIPWATWQVTAALALGVVSGILFPLLVAAVGAAISRGLDRALLLRILTLCAAAPCVRLGSQMLFDAIATRAIFDLRLELGRKLLATPRARLAEIGPPRLLASLDDGMAAIATTLGLLPLLAMQVGVMAGLLTYMAWLSPRWLLLVAAVFALGIGVLRLPGIRASRYQARARRETDAMSARLRDLVAGERRREFLDRELVPAGEALYRSTFLGSAAFTFAGAWSNILFFALPAMVLFGAGRSGADLPVLAGYTLALLYIRTPTQVLLQAAPGLGRANAAAVALQKLENELRTEEENLA